jgi:hypothetical protein
MGATADGDRQKTQQGCGSVAKGRSSVKRVLVGSRKFLAVRMDNESQNAHLAARR